MRWADSSSSLRMRVRMSSGVTRAVGQQHVECPGDVAGTVADRHRDRAQAELQLLVDDRPALPARLVDDVAQLDLRGHRVRRELLQLHPGNVGVELALGEARQQDPPGRARIGRRTVADIDPDIDDAARAGARHIHGRAAIQHCGKAGIPAASPPARSAPVARPRRCRARRAPRSRARGSSAAGGSACRPWRRSLRAPK